MERVEPMPGPRAARAWPAVALASATGLLVSPGSTLWRTGAVLAASAPLVVVAVVGLPVSVVATALVVSSLVSGGRFPFAGFNFLPEHVVVAVLLTVLVLRRPAAIVRRPATYEAWLLAWIAWNGLVSLVYADDPAASLAIVAWMLLAWLILWSVRGVLLTEPGARAQILRVGSAVAAAMGLVAFVTWLSALAGFTTWGVQPEFVTGTVASTGLALEANIFGAQGLFWLFLVVRARILHGTRLSSWVVLGLTLGIVSSMTRAVWLAAVVLGVGIFVVARTGRRVRLARPVGRLRAWVVSIAAVALLMVVGAPVGAKLAHSLDFGSSTGSSRLENWKVAVDDLGEDGAYLFGLGTNSFGQRHLSPTIPGEPDYLGNLGLALLYDTGVVGLGLFAGAAASIALRPSRARQRVLNLTFIAALLIIGAATSPVWFGFVWITVALLDDRAERRAQAPELGDQAVARCELAHARAPATAWSRSS